MDLQVKGNNIENINFLAADENTLMYLQKLDLSANKLTTIPNLLCKSLFNLVLDENEISKIELKGSETLKLLSLEKNKLANCDGL